MASGEDFMGSIILFAFNFAPKGYAPCNGQLLPINQNQGLFAVLGTTYGGDGRVNFALPDFRGKTAVHPGQGIVYGQSAGEENHTLTVAEMAQHVHTLNVDQNSYVKAPAGTLADTADPNGAYYAANPAVTGRFTNHQDTGMYQNTPFNTGNTGNGQPHNNMMPYLVLNFCIAITGIFPSRN
jgi:microcystin-dependent protein